MNIKDAKGATDLNYNSDFFLTILAYSWIIPVAKKPKISPKAWSILLKSHRNHGAYPLHCSKSEKFGKVGCWIYTGPGPGYKH